MMWWCLLAAAMFLLVMSPLLCRTTLVQCQFLLPFIVRKAKNLGYYLSGTTVDAGNSIFTNTASFSPAQGVGVQLTRNGTIIPANNTVSLGAVGTSAVSLGLTANYARTGGQVTAGNVQSIIGVTFCLSIKKSQGIANAVTQYYLKLKTCTLALCRPDKTRQRRIWHKQSALCWSVPLTLTLSPGGAEGDCPGHIF